MGAVVVFTWPIHGDFVGHSSMKLSDGTYISFWPKDSVNKHSPESPPMLSKDLAEDTSNEGGEGPDGVYILQTSTNGIRSIRAWWNVNMTSDYKLIDNNCSTVIFLALRSAFHFLTCLDGKVKIWVPKAIGLVAKGIPHGSGYFTEQKIQEIVDTAKAEIEKMLGGGKKGHKKGKKAGK